MPSASSASVRPTSRRRLLLSPPPAPADAADASPLAQPLTRVAREPRDDVVEQQPGLRLALGASPPPLDGEAERCPAAQDPRGAAGKVLGDPGARREGALGAPDD